MLLGGSVVAAGLPLRAEPLRGHAVHLRHGAQLLPYPEAETPGLKIAIN